MGMAAILINELKPFEQFFNPPFNRRFHMKFEEKLAQGLQRRSRSNV